MPRFARPAVNQGIGIPETDAGSRCGENAQAAAGGAGADVVCLYQRDRLTGPREFDSADRAGDSRADDRRIAGRREGLARARRDAIPPAGVRLNQFCALGVYISASSRVS